MPKVVVELVKKITYAEIMFRVSEQIDDVIANFEAATSDEMLKARKQAETEVFAIIKFANALTKNANTEDFDEKYQEAKNRIHTIFNNRMVTRIY